MSDFQAWGRQMLGDSFDTLDQSGIARLHANYEGRTEPTAADLSAAAPLIAAAASDPVEMERRRISRIESACRPGKWGEQEQRVSELKAAALAGSISEDGLRTELLECVKASIPMAHTVRSVNRTAANALTIEAALCQAINLPDLEKHFSDQILQAAHTAFRGRLGLQQILIQAAHGNGLDIMPGERISTGNLKRILKFALPDDGPQTIKAQGYSTLSVSGILSNTANKSLLLGWTESDQTWREVAQVKPSSDFKTATSYRLLDSLEYEQVGPAGEITHGTASNESYTRTINTYAKMLALTRTDIINDDLSAFEDLRVRIGRGAARKFNNLFWAKWLDDGAFFATAGTNNNYISGATTNLGTDGVGLTAGVLKFRKLVSSDGKRVDGEPVILLVPPEVEWIARRLFNSTKVIGSTTANAPVGDDNVFAGLYRPVVQPRLSDSAFTGNSTTAWWLLRSPAMGAVAVASFLNGQQNPTVETADADFNTLGIQLRGYHDFGVDLTVDYVAGIKSKGAA